MLNLLDVYNDSGLPGSIQLVASLDVTDNSETERAEVLSNARDLYGEQCDYYWHNCGHAENRMCYQSVS